MQQGAAERARRGPQHSPTHLQDCVPSASLLGSARRRGEHELAPVHSRPHTTGGGRRHLKWRRGSSASRGGPGRYGREEAGSGGAEVAPFSLAGGPAAAGRWLWGGGCRAVGGLGQRAALGSVSVFALCPAAISAQEGIRSWRRRGVGREIGFVVTLLSLHCLKTRGGIGGPKRCYARSAHAAFRLPDREAGRGLICGWKALRLLRPFLCYSGAVLLQGVSRHRQPGGLVSSWEGRWC